ncbi:MAG: DUF4149 domain-containing protein [Acidobacteria bacterium]|nr:DUF4149 domain-containing protein [Acidobacteriota bacterium]
MHTRRFAALLIGVWLSLMVCMTFVATQNFLGVERLIKNADPEAQKVMIKLAPGQARQLLRYQAGELNRFLFEAYGAVQLMLGVLLAGVLLFATNGHRATTIVSGVLILITLFQFFFLNKELAYMGQTLAYHPNELLESKFRDLHTAFGWVEALKGMLLFAIGAKLLVKREHRRPIRSAFLPDQETIETYR